MTTNSSDHNSTASQEADRVKEQTRSAAEDLGKSTKEQARNVKGEAVDQARSLASSVSDELSSQASNQQQRLASQSRVISDDLQRVARAERPESDTVNQLISQAADQAQRVTDHLESREPRELLDDVSRFASRRPGLFLAIAVGAGVVAGRLTRGLADHDDESQASPQHAYNNRSVPAGNSASTSGLPHGTGETRNGETGRYV